ncbi:DNA phosphorothioation-dependent restriction protein DptG [Clostridium cochlearium]|uniref:DNA phosphorothioation-dependent restriction protein DptG n=1 Tax=Clostridium cochlearium TaxID=1494 RepID=UPI0022E831D6|nr:DNA phosphorothioation-dependent restriction protein DptG [Clostridium cochlearium]
MRYEKQYKIDFQEIENTFKFKESGLTHSQGNKFKLLPYAANEKKLVSNFDGVVGAVSRIICGKELKDEFDFNYFIENIVDQIGEFEGVNSKDIFKDLVNTIFIDDNKLVNFDIKTINYIKATNSDEKIAEFLYSVLFDNKLKDLIQKHYSKDIENILYNLVLNALPELKNKEYIMHKYKCYVPFIKELFIKDFKFLIENEELYKNSLKRLIEYYYMFYVSQLAMKLSRFEKADLNKPEPIYYTLSWERTSKNRTAYRLGWELLKTNVDSLFSHAITLEFLNHHGLDEQLGYVELFELFNSLDESNISDQIELIYHEYISRITDKDWNKFKEKNKDSGNKAFNKVYKLFDAIEYQFHKSSRSRAKQAYNNWYIKFVHENFAKRRGALGYNLNLTEEDIILMTKLCINHNDKLKLNLLFYEFEKRGIFLDRDSKIKVIQLYEKLNLLEKKSDSGDAQYVRSIL